MRLNSIERPWKSNRLLPIRLALAGAVFGCVLGFARCTTPPPVVEPLTPQERSRRDLAVSAGLARQLESKLVFKTDKEVGLYLHELAVRLASTMPDLKDAALGVMVVSDHGALWRNFSIQGNRIYLSAGLLKQIRYENELAAGIAMEFAHLLKRHVPLRLLGGKAPSASGPADFPSIEGLVPTSSDSAAKEIDFFSPTGIYAYPDDLLLESVDVAVEILYKTGFDPRGLVALWGIYGKQPEHSPYDPSTLRKLEDRTRVTIAHYSPLRNPIVRSPAFLTVQKRIGKL